MTTKTLTFPCAYHPLAFPRRLRMGWSTGQSSAAKQEALSSEETAAILEVIKRAEELEQTEHQRIG